MFPQKARNLNGYNLTSVLRIVQNPMNKTREKVIEKLIKDENQLESIFEEKLVLFYQKISFFFRKNTRKAHSRLFLLQEYALLCIEHRWCRDRYSSKKCF